jgi:hypothetical protein
MNGPQKEGYWQEMTSEIHNLTKRMHAWDIVDRESWMNVLPSTWAFHCKRYPDGIIKKLKARLCARGDQQLEGVDYFKTCPPVINWQSVWIMLILSILLDLQTIQVDYTTAFLHTNIDKDPNWASVSEAEIEKSGVYLETPLGFRDEGKVLRLSKSLYRLKQAPRNFFLHLKGKLDNIDFVQSDFDPCIFISDEVICLFYVDDTLFFSPDQTSIAEVIAKLKLKGLELEIENDVAKFLGVHIDQRLTGRSISLKLGRLTGSSKPLISNLINIQSKLPANKDAWGLT